MKRGSSTLEILIAFAVLVLAFTAVIQTFFSNQTLPLDTQTNSEALSRAQALMEGARAASFSSLVSTTAGTDSIYSKNISVTTSASNANVKTVTSNTTWTTGARSLAVQLSSLLVSDPTTHGSTCNPSLTIGDWKNPQYKSFDSVNDLAKQATGNNANGLGIADVFVYQQKLYIAADYTANDNYDVYIFSIGTDPTTVPTYQGRVQTTGFSANAITVAPYGSRLYAYVLNAKNFNFTTCTSAANCPHLQVIDVTDPTTPSLVSTANIELPITGASGQGIGNYIYYDNGYVYIGLQKPASGPEFGIVDVGGGTGSPTNPILKGTYNLGGYTVTSIAVSGNYAYLTNTNNAAGNKQLLVLDISDKSNPHLTTSPVGGFYSPSGSGYGYAVAVANSKVYFGRSYSSSAIPNFYILDGSNPATYPSQLSLLGSKTVGTSDSVGGIAVRGTLAFLMTNNQFQVWDTAIPGAMTPYTSDGTTNTFLSLSSLISGGSYNGSTILNCTGNAFYMGLRTTGGSNKDVLSVIYPFPSSLPFAYALSNAPSSVALTRAGSSVSNTVTTTMTAGSAQAVTLTPSGMPAGVSVSPTSASCTPSSNSPFTCTASFAYSAADSATITSGSTITVTGSSPAQTTTFSLSVAAPAFTYTITNSSSQLTLTRGGSSVVLPVTVTMAAGAVPQTVTLTPPNPKPSQITITPSTATCTPSASSPYTCTVSFSYKASNSGPTNTYTNQTVTGTPNAVTGTAFSIKVQ